MKIFRPIALALLLFIPPGCTATTPQSYSAGASDDRNQIDPLLKAAAFNRLLTFENQDDLLFVKPSEDGEKTGTAPALEIKPDLGVRGTNGLMVTSEVTFDLSSLVSGRTFPGRFELVGVYAKTADNAAVGTSIESIYEVDGRQIGREFVQLTGVEASGGTNGFTPVMVPLKPLSARLANLERYQKHVLRLKPIGLEGKGGVVLDDLVIVDNRKVLVGYEPGKQPFDGALEVTRRGLGVEVVSPGRFLLDMNETQLSGWRLIEASSVRAIFEHVNGDKRVIYSSGVDIWSGKWSGLLIEDARVKGLSAGHEFPGRMVISEGRGRVDTLSPGDANNDGYNEQTGSYRIVAQSKRIAITLEPSAQAIQQGGLAYPVVEISGLPNGAKTGPGVAAMLAGRKIREAARLADGTVILVLPVVISGKATLSVTVE